MRGQGIDAGDYVIPMPPITRPIRTGDKKAMYNRKKCRFSQIKLELPVRRKPTDDLADPRFLPESLADQRWSAVKAKPYFYVRCWGRGIIRKNACKI